MGSKNIESDRDDLKQQVNTEILDVAESFDNYAIVDARRVGRNAVSNNTQTPRLVFVKFASSDDAFSIV